MPGHTPYGYVIVDGKAVIDKVCAKQVKQLYENYLDGESLRNAAIKAGMNKWHGGASRMLENKKYLGTKYYPSIIDIEVFDAVQKERHRRAVALGRVKGDEFADDPSIQKISPTQLNFWMKPIEVKFQDPYRQAEFAYSLIESEVI